VDEVAVETNSLDALKYVAPSNKNGPLNITPTTVGNEAVKIIVL
jgi:hypothetical protein